MANPKPNRVLKINQTIMGEVAFAEDPNDYWVGFPYRWRVSLAVEPQYHGSADTTTPFQYNGMDVIVGDWVATGGGGIAVKIVEIESQTETTIVAIVEDFERVNIVLDQTLSGIGIGPDGVGYIFQLSADGFPILGPIAAYTIDVSFQTDMYARFSKRNVVTNFVNVFQVGHGLNMGDIIAVNPNVSGAYMKASDPLLAVGTVNSVGIPTENSFTFRPFGAIIDDINPGLVGNYGDIFYMDPSNPGGLTKVRPLVNARPIYLRLEGPNRAVLFASGTAGGAVGGGDDTTNTLEVTPTLDQVEFTIPGAKDVVLMSINGVENNNFTFDSVSEVLTFDPVATGYGVDPTDEVIFIYNS